MKEQICKEYRLAMFRARFAHTNKEARLWEVKAAELKREYELFDDNLVEPSTYKYAYNRKTLPRRDILAKKTPEQIRSMLNHYQQILDSGELKRSIYRGVRLQNVVREHCAKLRAVLENKITSS